MEGSEKFVEKNGAAAGWGKGLVRFRLHSAGLRSSACVLAGDRDAVVDIERIRS